MSIQNILDVGASMYGNKFAEEISKSLLQDLDLDDSFELPTPCSRSYAIKDKSRSKCQYLQDRKDEIT